MGWFMFRQNNSGGAFFRNEEVAKFVFIQADSAAQANHRAEKVGIYFDGVATSGDCECCGDRWYRVDDDEETKTPMIYSEKVKGRKDPDHRFYPHKFFRR